MSAVGQGLDIVTTAEDLLQAVVDAYAAAAPGTVSPLPDRQGIYAGDPRSIAWDCSQLIVALDGIGYGPAADASSASARSGSPVSVSAIRHVVLVVQLVRCTPRPGNRGTVNTAELEAAGREFLRDAGMLSQALVKFASRVRQGLDSTTESVLPGVVDPVGPIGDFHAVETTLAITVATVA